MQLLSYLGKPLKSDEVIELLERFDMQVVYEFDRLHEDSPDAYYASAYDGGFQCGFNEHQVLNVIWTYVSPAEGHAAVDLATLGTPAFDRFALARDYAQHKGIRTTQSQSGDGWIRFEYDTAWVHYEFTEGRLTRVTLSRPNP
ncbi:MULTISPECIES: hypothetical protein [unclassified Achromobacter]|uniref:hypothetical protein n=1 Tax=unclassified Achromobacter TaxID=2626865 RepID=UPI000B51E426|nr:MULTISPECIES: hypothetical protein [unclassified Achromobacter]OWT77034.1 hypothetical protein CEY04_13630 [Achromobacter sp. HZ28]OWT77915.1 hypothetical protein CEY05_08125 [Achromobacter sp. HZ34]